MLGHIIRRSSERKYCKAQIWQRATSHEIPSFIALAERKFCQTVANIRPGVEQSTKISFRFSRGRCLQNIQFFGMQ